MKNWKYIEGAKIGNDIPDAQINGPSAAEIREVAGRIYKTDMREDDLARAVSFELAKKYKAFQTNTHLMDMVKEVLKKFKTGNSKTGNESLGEYMAKKPRVINEEKNGAEGFFKQLSDDVKEREKKDDEEIKLVGNETYQHKLYPDKYVIIEGNNYKIVTDGKVEKSGVLTDAVLYGINQTYKRVGNAKAIAYSESKKTENGLARARMAMNARSITYDDFLRKLENAINQSRDSVSFQMYGISDETVEAWAQKAKKEGYSQYIRDVRGAEVNLND